MYRVSEFGDQRSGEDSALRSWRAKLTSRGRCPEGLLIVSPAQKVGSERRDERANEVVVRKSYLVARRKTE